MIGSEGPMSAAAVRRAARRVLKVVGVALAAYGLVALASAHNGWANPVAVGVYVLLVVALVVGWLAPDGSAAKH